MRTLKRLILLASPVLLLASCSKDDIGGEPSAGGGDIKFEFGFAPQTRAATDAQFNSTWEDGDEIGLFAVKHNGTGGTLAASGNYIHNVKLTYNKTAGTWTPAETLFWPSDGKLDFYAYYPYDATATNPTAIAFNVLTDQSGATGGKSNYNLSDLLAAKADNGGSGYAKGATVPLVFSHMLGMVQVKVPSPGNGLPPNNNLIIRIQNVQTKAVLNLAGVSGPEVPLVPSDSDATTIKMYRIERPGDTDYATIFTYRAMIAPQSIPIGKKLFLFEQDMIFHIDVPLEKNLEVSSGWAVVFTRSLP